MGGSIVTVGGLVFIAATTDAKFRAFDSRTGKELWVAKLEATGDTVPITYRSRNGRQYVVVAAGGTNWFRMIANTASTVSDTLVAFSLSGGESPSSLSTEAAKATPIPASQRVQPLPSIRNSADSLPKGDGKDVVLRVCTKCHGVSVFSNLRMNRAGWANEISSMVEKGATGTDQELETVIDYLAANFR